MDNFKEIHIGEFIKRRCVDLQISSSRLSNYFDCNENVLSKMFSSKSLDSEILLKWSRILEYDFFRIYSQNLILYSPPSNGNSKTNVQSIGLPKFKKNIYTQTIIKFILQLIKEGHKTKQQIIDEYKIPKTTLYQWLKKYDN